MAYVFVVGWWVAYSTVDAQPDIRLGVQAYEKFWKQFHIYEKKLLESGNQEYLRSLDKLKQAFDKHHRGLSAKRVELLKRSELAYVQQLNRHPDSSARPFALLNLAGVYVDLFAESLRQDDSGSTYLDQAASLLIEVQKRFPDFRHRDWAAYLLAIVYYHQDDIDSALAAWRLLTKEKHLTIYRVHAFTALGDHHFAKDDPARALELYRQGYDLLQRVDITDKEVELIKLEYRNLWAAYRSANFPQTVAFGQRILVPNRFVLNVTDLAKIRLDAVELVGDALYDQNDLSKVLAFLSQDSIRDAIAPVMVQIMKRHDDAKHYRRVVAIGKELVEKIPLSLESPSIFYYLGRAFGKRGRIDEQMKTYESMAYLLPSNSLWRQRFGANGRAVTAMENLAFESTVALALWSYKRAFTAHQAHLYIKAASFFAIASNFRPNHDDAATWDLYRANCYYYASQFDEAIMLYNQLKDRSELSDSLFETVAYQIVLTQEQKWKEVARQAHESQDKERYDTLSMAALTDLQDAIDFFVAKFPDTERSIDLLLVGASAYRDHGAYPQAMNMWEKVLLSEANLRQRKFAIRGILFAKTAADSPKSVVASARRYLKLEDWSQLDDELHREVLQILSQASSQEAEHLKKAGKLTEAGNLLVEVARDFASLPGRAAIMREGAYTLALGDRWRGAHQATLTFEQAGMKRHADDMQYLKARSLEYLLRFSEAADAYMTMATRYPQHKKRLASVRRAKILSAGDERFQLAGDAALLEAQLTRTVDARLPLVDESIAFYLQAGNAQKAIEVAQKRWEWAKGIAPKLESRIVLAETYYLLDRHQQAQAKLDKARDKVIAYRNQLPLRQFRALMAEVDIALAKSMIHDLRRSGNLPISERRRIFGRIRHFLEDAISQRSPVHTGEARWLLAVHAERLAVDILEGVRSGRTAASTKMEQQGSQLIEFAKKLHGANVVDSARYQVNDSSRRFMMKSKMRLAHSLGEFTRVSYFPFQKPYAYQYELPYQWSTK